MSNNDLKNDIKVIQLNPKLRLFFFIFSNWLMNIICILILASPFLAAFLSGLEWFFYSLGVILIICSVPLVLFCRNYMYIGIKYLPKDLYEYYTIKNKEQLQKIDNLKITNVVQLFNVTPVCTQLYTKKQIKLKKGLEKGLTWVEASSNRLVVNGKINNLDFSWGIATKIKKNNFKVFILAILYFGPVTGFFVKEALVRMEIKTGWGTKDKKYKKIGCLDLFPYNVGRVNSENYLIFSAKLKNKNDLITLTPKSNDHQSSNLDPYEWPANISNDQKKNLQKLIQNMSFLPSIYLDQDNISIVMKKYYYNEKDNSELQTWELLKNEQSINDVQFNYFNDAIKIYNIFNN